MGVERAKEKAQGRKEEERKVETENEKRGESKRSKEAKGAKEEEDSGACLRVRLTGEKQQVRRGRRGFARGRPLIVRKM